MRAFSQGGAQFAVVNMKMLALGWLAATASALVPGASHAFALRPLRPSIVMGPGPTEDDVGVGAKAVWFATEAFGKLAAKARRRRRTFPRAKVVDVLSSAEVEAA